jgi:hypothetical protein
MGEFEKLKITTIEPRFRIKTLMPGDPDWHFSNDNLTLTPRASFSISQRCPVGYRQIIEECIDNGWLKPVAHMKNSEYMWEQLSK